MVSVSGKSKISVDVFFVCWKEEARKVEGFDFSYLVVPNFFIVVDDGGAEAPGGVDAGAGDGDGGKVDHEDSKPNGQGSQNLKQPTKKIVKNRQKLVINP